MAVSPSADQPLVGYFAIIISFAMVGLTVMLVGLANNGTVSDEQRAAVVAEDELMEVRRTLELASLEVIALRMYDGLGIDGDRSARLSAAADELRDAETTVTELSAGEGLIAEAAEAILEDLPDGLLKDPLAADLSDLFELAEETSRYGGANGIVTNRREAIQQLSFVSALPLHTVVEGVGADVLVSDRPVEPSTLPFIRAMGDVVRTEGGWFGVDPTIPLDGSIWIEIDDAKELFPAQTSLLNELVASSDLVSYDAWMRELGDGDDTPPFELPAMLAAADELQLQLVNVVDELFAEEHAALLAAFDDRESQRGALLTSSAIAGVLAFASFVLGIWIISRAGKTARDRAEMAARDPLTGVGNRFELNERTRALSLDARFDRHLLAMIDLDKFKMVNDALGHAAGDAVLVAVASGLQSIADRLEHAGAKEVSVIRLGGDEFLVTAHGAEDLRCDALHAELDSLRCSSIDHGDERVELGFSMGLVKADGPHELAGLMSEADLLVYEDKAMRARERSEAKSHEMNVDASDPISH